MRNIKFLLLTLLVVALIPYLAVSFYALPFADDFCFGWTASENISFAQKFLKQYLGWNGRYTSDVLVNLHPITSGRLLVYQLVSFFSILATPFVIFLFVRQWVNNNSSAVMTALFISLFYLCYLPNITEGVYWYIGLVNYHWGSLCFLAQLTLLAILMKGTANRPFVITLSLLLLIMAVGFNEIAAALIPALYLGALIYLRVGTDHQPDSKPYQNILLVHFIAVVIASAFVIGSPGNFARENAFYDRFNFMHSFFFAGLQTIRFLVSWISSIPFIALSLLVMVNSDKVTNVALRKIHAGVWLSLILFTVFIAALIPYLATGILGQHRTMNYVFPFFILLWIGFLLSLSSHYRFAENRTPETSGIRVLILAISALVVMSVTGNALKILADFRSGAFCEYRAEFMNRQTNVLRNPLLPIPSVQKIPGSFQVVDAKGDTTWWVDKCMKRFYTETNIVLQ